MEIVDEKYINTAYSVANMLAKGISTVVFQFICGRIVDMFSYSILYYFYAAILLIVVGIVIKFKISKKEC